jgi:GntR family transcriptional regulator
MSYPMYKQIADDLQRKIESGKLGPGDQLPTESELREGYKASLSTVRSAVRWLATCGFVETRQGQGSFVRGKIDPFVATLGLDASSGRGDTAAYLSEVRREQRRPESHTPEIEPKQATETVARDLQIAVGTTVVIRRQQRYIDDVAWSIQTTFYPYELVERGARRILEPEKIEPGVVRYIEETLGVREVGWREIITVRAPEPREIEFFLITGADRVYEIRRIGFDESGKPVRVTATSYRTDRNQFVINIGQVPEK